MKQLTLLSLLACSVILTGCSTAAPTETTTTTDIVQPSPTIELSGDMVEPSTTTIVPTESTDVANTTTTESITTTKAITVADVAKHTTESDCRTAINGTVYDVTAFFGKHPGGDKNLFRVCGIDATQVFERKHGGDMKANNVLAGFEIGTLAQ